MAKLVFGMNVSLDGYVDHTEMGAPEPVLFRHFVAQAHALTGSVYGRLLYETMRYWDDDDASWDEDHRAFAQGWRAQKKWVVSHTLKSVGPNAELLQGDVEAAVRTLKAEVAGEVEVGGPMLAGWLTELGLIDEYWLYLHPHVLGQGKRFFAGARPPLKLVSSERIGGAMRLVYAPG